MVALRHSIRQEPQSASPSRSGCRPIVAWGRECHAIRTDPNYCDPTRDVARTFRCKRRRRPRAPGCYSAAVAVVRAPIRDAIAAVQGDFPPKAKQPSVNPATARRARTFPGARSDGVWRGVESGLMPQNKTLSRGASHGHRLLGRGGRSPARTSGSKVKTVSATSHGHISIDLDRRVDARLRTDHTTERLHDADAAASPTR